MPDQPDDWKAGLPEAAVDEVDHIIDALHEAHEGRIEIKVARTDEEIDYLYAEGRILVRDQHLEDALAVLEPDGGERARLRNDAERVQRLIPGVSLVVLGAEVPALAAIAAIEQQAGIGIATPDHVLTVAPRGSPCPATEAEVVYEGIEPYPSACRDGGGTGVLVYIDDTGLLKDADATHPWLAGVHAGNIDPLPPLVGGVQHIKSMYTGHGTFVAGVVRCMAPAADLIVSNVLRHGGSQLESHWIQRLEAALGLGVDIFHLSVATHSRHDLPLITFQEWLKHLHEYGGAVCVVPAGNFGSRRLTWPAATSGVISVGALGKDWRGRASFSDFGSWVDVYAPGRDLVNAYATGIYKCHVAPYKGQERHFYGMAKWSGTSFSTPIVSGLIAARMSRTGQTARHAAAALLAEARAQAIPGVGPVLLPCCGGDDPRPCCRGTGHQPCCGGGDPRPCCR